MKIRGKMLLYIKNKINLFLKLIPFLTIIFLFFLIFPIRSLAAEWTYSGLDGGLISSVSISQNTVYVVSQKYIYKSIDKGESFQKINTFSDVGKVIDDKSNPNVVYAIRTNSVYKSSDGGVVWSKFFNSGARDFIISPKDSTFFILGTNNKVYKSIDNGNNWVIVNDGLSDEFFPRTLAVSPINPLIVYVGGAVPHNSGHGGLKSEKPTVYFSSNEGGNWQPTEFYNKAVSSLTVSYGNSAVVYAGTKESATNMYGNIYTSHDYGQSWTSATMISDISKIIANPLNPNYAYAVGEGGLFSTKNLGESWTQNYYLRYHDLYDLDNYYDDEHFYLYLASGNGLLKSTSSENSWQLKAKGIQNAQVSFVLPSIDILINGSVLDSRIKTQP